MNMRYFSLLFVGLLFEVTAEAQPLTSALKSSYEPSYGTVIFSLIFVICLIYATGIVYNRLNNLGIKALKAQKKDAENDDRIIILSTTPLGANRTLHVVELNGKKMLIGASANSIHLIKDLSENSCIIEENNSPTEADSVIEEEISDTSKDDEFGLYKKYLR